MPRDFETGETAGQDINPARARRLAHELVHWPIEERAQLLSLLSGTLPGNAVQGLHEPDLSYSGGKLYESEVLKTGAGRGQHAGGIQLHNVDRVFTYQAWDKEQIRQAEPVKEAIVALAKAILRHVPDCPDRSVGLRKLRELRMDVNSAITHRGEF